MKTILTVKVIMQPFYNACWLACYQMLFAFKEKDPDTVKSILESAGFDMFERQLHGLDPLDAPKTMKALGLRALLDLGLLSPAHITNTLRHYGPLWISGHWNGNFHVMVVTGADDMASTVQFIDPFPDISGGKPVRWEPFAWVNGGLLTRVGKGTAIVQHW